MQNNILDKFRGKSQDALNEIAGLYLKAAEVPHRDDCLAALSYLEDAHPDVYSYIMEVPLEQWALSYRPFDSFGKKTNGSLGKYA